MIRARTLLIRLARRVVDLSRRDLRRRLSTPVERVGSVGELASRLGRPIRVAVVRLDGLGDWALTLPLLTALRRHDSVGSVVAVAPAGVSAMLGTGSVSGVETLTFSTVPRAAGRPRRLRRELARTVVGQRQALRAGADLQGAFDLVVVPRWETDIGYNCRAWGLATGAVMAGHDPATRSTIRPSERHEGQLYGLVSSDPRPVAHEIERLRHLMRAIGVDDLVDPVFGRTYFDLGEPGTTPGLVTIHTGAGHPKRRWPLDRWSELIGHLLADERVRVRLVGGPEDVADHEVLGELSDRVTSAVATSSLADLPRLLAETEVFVGGDSGPAHVAAGVGARTVVLSPHPAGATIDHVNSPERFAPVGPDVTVLRPDGPASPACADGCVAGGPHCIAEIPVATVLAAMTRR